MVLTLYMVSYSEPVRAVLMLIDTLGLDVKLREISLLNKEHYSDWFLKINPQHTVPTLDDDGFVLWDSHVIMTYLVQKYGKDDSLYPKDIYQRAIVNQRMHFESAILFPLNLATIHLILYKDGKMIPEDRMDDILKSYTFLESFIRGQEWMAGKTMTIADFSIVTTLTTLDYVLTVDPEEHPCLTAWMKRMEIVPHYDRNLKGLEILKRKLKEKTG